MSTNHETTNLAPEKYRRLQEVLRRMLEAFKGTLAVNGVADHPRWKLTLDRAEALRPEMEMDPPAEPQIWRKEMERLRGFLRELYDAWGTEATGQTTLEHPDWFQAWADSGRLLNAPPSLHVVAAAPANGKVAALSRQAPEPAPALILRPTQWTLQPPNEPIYGRQVTVLAVEDEGGGEYLSLFQPEGTGKISISPEEWPLLREAVDAAMLDLREKGGAA